VKQSAGTSIILNCFRSIPWNLRRNLFIGLFGLFYRLSPRYRLIAFHNLKQAFPEKDTNEILNIIKGVYRTMGIVTADFFEIPSLTRENIGNWVEVRGLDNCTRALEKNKGLLMFGAHFGNWELEAIVVSLILKPVDVIYRPLDNPLLDNLVAQVRTATGNTPVPKERAMRQILRSIKNNGILGILIDQNVAWQEGVFVDFFGRPACTTDGLALLALHTEAPVIPAYIVRLENGKYRLIIGEEMKIIRTGKKSADILNNTQNFTKVIEDTVRKYPDQWLWVHHRWKTKVCQVPRTVKESGAIDE
jgi:KDO2-lipid IV(A) lauroyltransferase